MVDRCGELRPEDRRASAKRFSPERVAAGYEAIYHDALAGGVEAGRVAPRAWQPVS
jgi:hypothetical protein